MGRASLRPMGYAPYDDVDEYPYDYDLDDDEPCGDPECSFCYPQDDPAYDEERCGDPDCSYCYPYEHEAPQDDPVVAQAARVAGQIADELVDAYEQGVEDGYEEGYQQGVLDGGRDALALITEQASELGVDPKLLAVATLALDLNDKLDDWAPSVDEELELIREGFKAFYAEFLTLVSTVADIAEGQDARLDLAEADAPVVESLLERVAELENEVFGPVI